MPKASQVYNIGVANKVYDPDGVVALGCLLWSINLVSLRDMKTICKALEPNSQKVVKKHYYKHSLYADSVSA